MDPWAEFCVVGCNDAYYCLAHDTYCDWAGDIPTEGPGSAGSDEDSDDVCEAGE
jgi:hypothetical protein